MLPWEDRLFVNVSGGGQVATPDFQPSLSFPLFDETGTLEAPYNIDSGGFFDVSAGVRIWQNLAAGVAVTRFSRSSDITLAARVPHPLFVDRLRDVTGIARGVGHSQTAVHLQAVWMLPLSDRIDLAFSAGPSIFTVSSDLITTIRLEPEVPPFEARVSGVTVERGSGTTVGFNIGADWSYLFRPAVGAGTMLRYTRGSGNLDVPGGGTVSVDAGGFQMGAGIRLRWR